jgi:hypothetical protein
MMPWRGFIIPFQSNYLVILGDLEGGRKERKGSIQESRYAIHPL